MSNRPDEALLDAVVDAPVLAAAVEAHLDQFPLLVDEDEVQSSAARLEARLGGPTESTPRWWLLGVLVLAAAAAVLLSIRLAPETSEAPRTVQPTEVRQAVTPPTLERVETQQAETELVLPSVERTLTVEPETVMISSQSERSAVLLVQKGLVHDETIEVPAGHWALFTQHDGTTEQVVFRDGEAPPELDPETWDVEAVDQQLEGVRWESLPDRTTDTLERLLERR